MYCGLVQSKAALSSRRKDRYIVKVSMAETRSAEGGKSTGGKSTSCGNPETKHHLPVDCALGKPTLENNMGIIRAD